MQLVSQRNIMEKDDIQHPYERPVTAFHLFTTERNQKAFDDIFSVPPAGSGCPGATGALSPAHTTPGCPRHTWAGSHCSPENLTRKTRFNSLWHILWSQGLSATFQSKRTVFVFRSVNMFISLLKLKKRKNEVLTLWCLILPPDTAQIHSNSSLESLYQIKNSTQARL